MLPPRRLTAVDQAVAFQVDQSGFCNIKYNPWYSFRSSSMDISPGEVILVLMDNGDKVSQRRNNINIFFLCFSPALVIIDEFDLGAAEAEHGDAGGAHLHVLDPRQVTANQRPAFEYCRPMR